MGRLIKFDYVNAHSNFLAVLDHYSVEYTKNGDQLRLRCPLPDHDDTNPSFSVTLVDTGDTKANTWHCFGCQNSGSIIDFVALIDGLELRPAAEKVAEISGCALAPPRSGSQRSAGTGNQKPPRAARTEQGAEKGTSPPEKPEDSAPGAAEEASEVNPPLKFTLKTEPEHPYLAERVDPDAAELFELGYVPSDSRTSMAGRIVIPIHNLDGELIAYAGRYPSDRVPDGTEKYQLPPGFAKLSALFNCHRVGATTDIVIVEGFFSAIRLHMLGAPVVALMGTAVGDDQITLLRELGVRCVLVLLDGDEPGRKARPSVVDALARSFFVTVGELPDGFGPDEVDEAVLDSFAAVFD